MERAYTFDLVVLDASLGYQKYIQDKAEGKKEAPKMNQEDLIKMMERTKQKDGTKL